MRSILTGIYIRVKGRILFGMSSLILMSSMLAGCANSGVASGSTTSTSVTTTSEAVATVSTETSSTSESVYNNLFKEKSVIDVKIEIPEADLTAMMANPTDEKYYSANVTIGDTTLTNIGFRTKGNSSLKSVASSDSNRFSFRVKLDEYVDGQKLDGLDELVLNNMFSDATYLREYISYQAMSKMGLNAPLATFAKVTINGELYGFYLCAESIDDSFLNRNFGNNDGNLYKQEQGSTLSVDSTGKYDSYVQKNGEDTSKTDIKKLIETLDAMPEGEKGDIESVLDVDSALKYIASNAVLGNFDSYSGNFAQNYFLYSQNGKFTVIPWDFNMAFGGFQGGGSSIDINAPVSGTEIDKRPLIKKLLAVPEYKAKYYEYLEQYATLFADFKAQVADLAEFVRPYVEADPTKFVTMDQFENGVSPTVVNPEQTAQNMGPGIGNFGGHGNFQERNGNTTEGAIDGGGKAWTPSLTESALATKQTSGATANDGNRPQRPADGNMLTMPTDGNMPTMTADGKFPDDGNRPDGFGDGKGMGGGGNMTNSIAIINYMETRLASILEQIESSTK